MNRQVGRSAQIKKKIQPGLSQRQRFLPHSSPTPLIAAVHAGNASGVAHEHSEDLIAVTAGFAS